MTPLATVVYPVPTVYCVALDAVSTFPITKELDAGVNEVTEAVAEPALLPVDVCKPAVVAPDIS